MSVAWVAAAIAAVGVGVSAYNGDQQQAAQKKANAEAIAQQKAMQASQEKQTADQLKLAEQDTNKLNAKRPNTAGILGAAQQAGKSGASGTMLTGPSGVDPSALQLGKSTLLGM